MMNMIPFSKVNADLENAYQHIRKEYTDLKKDMGCLRKIGFRSMWNYVVTGDNQTGVAFNFTGDHAVYGPVDDMGQFTALQPYIGRGLPDFVEYLLSRREIQMWSVCLAALNALSQPLIEQYLARRIPMSGPAARKGCFDFIAPDDVVTVVGYGGVINNVYGRCRECHVCDMRPRHRLQTLTVGERIAYGPEGIYFHAAADCGRVLAASDVVMITGCTLVNGTLRGLIRQSKRARVIGVFGPSAGIAPDYLVDCGVNYISSSKTGGAESAEHMANAPGSCKSCMEPYVIRLF